MTPPRLASLFALVVLAATAGNAQPASEAAFRRALQTKTGSVTLPPGVIEISREIVLPSEAHDLTIHGAAATIKASAEFRGRALLILPAGRNIRIENLTLQGNRDAAPQPVAAAPATAMLSRVVANNGILAEDVTGLEISGLHATRFPGFPILVNGGRAIRIHDVEITESGTLDASGHNNGSGGIVLEEGVADFEILRALIGKIRGNGIWIRSTGAQTAKGRIAENEFAILARAAVELNHATGITIENNTAHMLGFPGEEALIGGTALPAGIATTGAVDRIVIRNNTFAQFAGRCFSLDGFSDSELTGNQCSDGLFNAVLIRGNGNRVAGNHFTALNSTRRDQPESLRAGIYLAAGASGNALEANEISGYGMAQHCIGGPGLAANTVTKNACSDGASVALLLRAKPR